MKHLAAIVTVMLLLLGAGVPAYAGIEQIEVLADVYGDDPQDAQQKAVDYAKKRAFFLMLSKLAPDKAETIARSLSSEQIYSYIRGYEVVQDRLAWNRYTAKYRVSVSEDMVSRLLVTDEDIDKDRFNPVLILPVYDHSGQMMLWEGDNVWRTIWNSMALEKGDGILIMPYGDPTDTQMLSGSNVLGYGFDYLQAIAARYGAAEVVVALARPRYDKEPMGLQVTLRRLGERLDKIKETFFIAESKDEPVETVMNRAARDLADQLKDVAKEYQGEMQRKIMEAKRQRIHVEFRRLSDWVNIQDQLTKMPRVVRLDVSGIDINSAEATLLYNGNEGMILKILRANGLTVEPTADLWKITLN